LKDEKRGPPFFCPRLFRGGGRNNVFFFSEEGNDFPPKVSEKSRRVLPPPFLSFKDLSFPQARKRGLSGLEGACNFLAYFFPVTHSPSPPESGPLSPQCLAGRCSLASKICGGFFAQRTLEPGKSLSPGFLLQEKNLAGRTVSDLFSRLDLNWFDPPPF